jgi:hypothetical protein
MVRPLLEVTANRARILLGESSIEMTGFVDAGLTRRMEEAGHRWFRFDKTYRAWSALATEAILDSGGDLTLVELLADRASILIRDQAPWLWLDIAAALTVRGLDAGRAADLCLRAADFAQQERYSAADRLELLAECAAQAGDVSAELGQTLFGRTMEAAAGIDDNAAQLLDVHATLAAHGAPAIPASQHDELAGRLLRLAEHAEKYVTESGVVPHSAVLGAACRLHPPTAFAAACRWDDEDRFPIESALPELLTAAVDAAFLDVPEALALQHMLSRADTRVTNAIELFERLPPGATRAPDLRRSLRNLADWLRRYVPASEQPGLARQVMAWADEGGLGSDELHGLLDPILAFDGASEARPSYAPSRRWSGTDTVDPTVVALLAAPETRTWMELAADVQILSTAHVGSDEIHRFILAVLMRADPNERISALEAVSALAGEVRSTSRVVLEVLADGVYRWRNWPGVAAWAAGHLASLLQRHLPTLAWETDTCSTRDTLRRFGVTDDEIRGSLLGALHDRHLELSIYQHHNLARLFAELTGPQAAATSLTALLDDVLSDEPLEPITTLPSTAEETIAGMLWSLFGHPRKGMRWRAAHAGRALLALGKRGIVDSLVARLDATSAGAFRSADLQFYWLSARVWVLVTLQRVAAERPDELARHAVRFIAIATDQELPHAQIREIARSAALRLHPNDAETANLIGANRPVACHVDRSRSYDSDDRRRAGPVRYDFDSMDTLPYWYAPLARVFAV